MQMGCFSEFDLLWALVILKIVMFQHTKNTGYWHNGHCGNSLEKALFCSRMNVPPFTKQDP